MLFVWQPIPPAAGCDPMPRCIWAMPTEEFVKVHLIVRVSVGFVIPISIIITCYVYIFVRLRRRATNAEMSLGATVMSKKQNRVTKMITAVITAFVICWLPNNIINFMQIIEVRPPDNAGEIFTFFGLVLGYTNSCINPILYAFMKADVREEIKKVFDETCMKCCGSASTSVPSVSKARDGAGGARVPENHTVVVVAAAEDTRNSSGCAQEELLSSRRKADSIAQLCDQTTAATNGGVTAAIAETRLETTGPVII